MKRIYYIFALLMMSGMARAAPTTLPAKPNTVIAPANCVTSECHADVKQYKVVHGPVNVNACEACHKATDVTKHEFALARPKAETCTFCHQIETVGMPVVHKPVTDRQCLSCHDPHGGTTGKFLRKARMDQLCNDCHQDPTAGKSKIHGPVAAAACGSCHQAHASKNPKLLVATGRDLCFTCHVEMKAQMARVQFKHKAVEQDCITCHDPHASNYPMQTRDPPVQLCTNCHEHDKIKEAALLSSNKHSIVTSGDGCLNCHTAHGGDLAKLLKNDQMKVCMKCHNEPQKDLHGQVIPAVSEVLDLNMTKHGPINEKNCAGCHNVHGSDVSHLLAKQYPAQFYQGFALEKYALCFTCHDKQLVLTQKTTGLTKFRNGDENLHFVHVNKADRGRNCRACHDLHAGPQPLLVRTSVPYGNWEMPINFKPTATGGSCAPGCHKEFKYDRDSPVNLKADTSTTKEAKP